MNKVKLVKILPGLLQEAGILLSLFEIRNKNKHLKIYQYQAKINEKTKYYEARGRDLIIRGISFESSSDALLNCLMELIKRVCLFSYSYKSLIVSDFNHLTKYHTLDPSIYTDDLSIKNKKLGWIKGVNLIKEEEIYVPAQFVDFNYITNLFYKKNQYEPTLSEVTTVESSIGFSKQQCLLEGIYEKVAQDAAMTRYLNKMSALRLDVNSINNSKVHELLKYCKQYHIEWSLFDISNDLNIPTYLSFLVDKTGEYPALTAAVKSDQSPIVAVVGSLDIVIRSRIWAINELDFRKSRNMRTKFRFVNNRVKRMLLWADPQMLKKLNFLLKQQPKRISILKSNDSEKSKLRLTKQIFSKKKIDIYYVDVTMPIFKLLSIHVYKVIIPALQPRYLNEKMKELRKGRLTTNNSIPHPFT